MECILFLQKYDKLLKNSGRVKGKIDNVKIYYRKSEVQRFKVRSNRSKTRNKQLLG